MTLRHMKIFTTVYRCGSVTRAAQELHLAQPSLSVAIRELEDYYGVALFDRSRRNRIALTPAGHLFQQSFQKSVQNFQDTLEQVRLGQKDQALELRVGVAAGWDWGGLTAACGQALLESWPQARILWTAHTFRYLHSALADGALDVIFCPQTGLEGVDGLEVARVAQAEATVYYGEAHPLATDIKRGYFATRLVLPEVVVLPNRESILLALSSGKGFAVFDSMMTLRRNPAYRTLGLGLPIPICGVWKARTPSPLIKPVVQWLAGALGQWEGGWEHQGSEMPTPY